MIKTIVLLKYYGLSTINSTAWPTPSTKFLEIAYSFGNYFESYATILFDTSFSRGGFLFSFLNL